MNSRPFRKLLGSLLYASITARPDIAYITNQLARYQENPGVGHWKAALRVLSYLKRTKKLKIVYKRVQKPKLCVYVDASFAQDKSRRSISGYVAMYGGAPVDWRSKRQTRVATSTMHAEVAALDDGGREAKYLRTDLPEIRIGDTLRVHTKIKEGDKERIQVFEGVLINA